MEVALSVTAKPLSRALRAALAVTLAGHAACGAEPGGAGQASESDTSASGADGSVDLDTAMTDANATDSFVDDVEVDEGEDTATLVDTESEDSGGEVSIDSGANDTEDVLADSTPEDIAADVDTVPDTTVDASDDTGGGGDADAREDADAVADADGSTTPPDVISEPICKDETDEVCAEGCTEDNDIDCCIGREDEGLFCMYTPGGGGCGCAAAGPFAPPSTGPLAA